MAYIERGILPRLRTTNAARSNIPAIQPIYLGMHPLPLGVVPPVKPPFPIGGDKVATVSISGISTGGVTTGPQSAGTKNSRVRRKTTSVRSGGQSGKKRKGTNSAGKKKARGKVPPRGKNGKFLKGGK